MRVIKMITFSDVQIVCALRAFGFAIGTGAESVECDGEGVRFQWEYEEPIPMLDRQAEPKP
jgi:hypothetical protein